MKQARWYPTCLLLPDKRVFVTGGMDDYGTENRLVEIYNPTSKSWSINYDFSRTYTYCVGSEFVASCSGAGAPCYAAQIMRQVPGFHFIQECILCQAAW